MALGVSGVARVQIRDPQFLRQVYEWLASHPTKELQGDVARQGILASSLAKLGVAGWLDCRDLGLSKRRLTSETELN